MKRVLIEDWLPIRELGAESKRESSPIPGQFPKLKTLHVWWARRPLVASTGVVLASVMPAWSKSLADAFPEAAEVQSVESYRKWFLHLCGIWGDPIAAQAELAAANLAGKKLKGNGYGYKQAFRNSPSKRDLDLLRAILVWQWGEVPLVADSTAGGGSIPFAASRMCIPVLANDLNPVAAGVLAAGVEIPASYGTRLVEDLKSFGTTLVSRIQSILANVYPATPEQSTVALIFTNAVRCPRTGGWVPLIKQRWLNKEDGAKTAIRFLTTNSDGSLSDYPGIEIVTGDAIDFDPSVGTVKGGVGTSIYDGLAIPSAYITEQAQKGEMRQILVAVATKTKVGARKSVRGFRAPTAADIEALVRAEEMLAQKMPAWESQDVIPSEEIPEGNDMRPRQYGMPRWRDMFTPRQLLVHGTFVEEFRKLIPEVRETLSGDPERADAVLFELGLMIGKSTNWDSKMSSWDVSRQKMRSVFDRHDFAFKWDFAEFQGADELYPWCLSQLTDAYGGIAELLDATGKPEVSEDQTRITRSVVVFHGNAADLVGAKDGSVALVCMDPPYHDNVMYAELSDYFYVWEKRTCGLIRPDLYDSELTDKDNEAVANLSRFKDFGKGAKALAKADYERKMAGIFSECRRVLRDDGIFTLMFTHKSADAWSALGKAVIEAGFVIETSWPVRTESALSLHQVDQAAAASTIMLACRKRIDADNYGHSLQQVTTEIQHVVAETIERCEEAGIQGVDQLLSTYGPALAVVSAKWPVYGTNVDESGNANVIEIDDVLTVAQEEVMRIQRQRVFGSSTTFDSVTDFILLAWSMFRSREIPFDDARKLAFNLGHLNLETLENMRLITNAKGIVTLLEPSKRIGKVAGNQLRLDGVDPNASLIDAVHAAIVIGGSSGIHDAKEYLQSTGLSNDTAFRGAVQALLNALPRAKNSKGDYEIVEVGILSEIGHTLSLDVPPDPVFAAPMRPGTQLTFDGADGEGESDDNEEIFDDVDDGDIDYGDADE